MAYRVTFGDGAASATSSASDTEKALAEVSVGNSSSASGSFIGLLAGDDADNELTQEQVLKAWRYSPVLRTAVAPIARAVGAVDYKWEDDNAPDGWSTGDPNRWHQSAQFMSLHALYLSLPGKVFTVKINGANGAELLPIAPHYIEEPEFGGDGYQIEDELLGFSRSEFDRDELIILQDPDPIDPFEDGHGAAMTLGDDIDVDRSAAEHTSSFLQNNARPDMLLTVDGKISDQEQQRLRRTLQQKHGGPKNAGRGEVLKSADIDVHLLSQSFEDLGTEDLRRYSAKVARELFGVPPSITGNVENTNRATAETEEYLFKKNVIKPLVSDIVEGLNEQFIIPDLGEQYRLTTEQIVPEDKRFKKEIMVQLPQAFRVNEARKLAGEEPMEGDKGERTLVEARPEPAASQRGSGAETTDKSQKKNSNRHQAGRRQDPAGAGCHRRGGSRWTS